MPLTPELKDDIDRSFKRLINNSSLTNKKKTISEAKLYIDEHLSRNYPKSVLSGLERGHNLIEKLNVVSDKESQQVILAALEYLIDPWDIIPDFVAEDGFLDDIYVIDQALITVNKKVKSASHASVLPDKETTTKYSEWGIFRIGGAAGPHLAKRAKNLNILSGYQRKALFDIGRKELYGYELTKKQYSFFETLLEDIIEEGVLEYECPDSPCKYCSILKNIYR